MKSSSLPKSFFLLTVIIILTVGAMYLFQFRGWERIKTTNAPPAVAAGSVAYNKNSDYALLFGGTSAVYVDSEWKSSWSSETWKWDGSSWEQVQTKNAPPPRAKHAMAYDEIRDVIVLFGGSADGKVFNDTWEWTGKIGSKRNRSMCRRFVVVTRWLMIRSEKALFYMLDGMAQMFSGTIHGYGMARTGRSCRTRLRKCQVMPWFSIHQTTL